MPRPDGASYRVAVTGASGFIGRQLIECLAAAGMQVRALYHKHKPPEHARVEMVRGALDDPASLHELVRGVDVVIHAGGIVAARRDRDFHQVNLIGTRALVTAAVQEKVPRFLLISSLAARLPGISPYAASKYAAECVLREDSTLAWDIIRPPAVYGPRDRQVLTLLKLLQHGVGILPAGRDARVSIIHVSDLADAMACWVEAGVVSRAVYEIDDGTPGGHRWQDILGEAAQIMGIRPRYIVPPKGLLGMVGFAGKTAGLLGGPPPFLTNGKIRELRHPQWVCGSNEVFMKQIGWQPRIPLSQGMASTLQWYRMQGWLK